jgi:hypothetical protein
MLLLMGFQEVITVAVDHLCPAHDGHSLRGLRERAVNVTMDKIFRGILVNEPSKTAESSVTEILGILNKPRRRVSHHKIHSSSPPEGRPERGDDPLHLMLLELVGSAVVPAGPFESKDVRAFERHEPLVQIGASLGWL